MENNTVYTVCLLYKDIIQLFLAHTQQTNTEHISDIVTRGMTPKNHGKCVSQGYLAVTLCGKSVSRGYLAVTSYGKYVSRGYLAVTLYVPLLINLKHNTAINKNNSRGLSINFLMKEKFIYVNSPLPLEHRYLQQSG